MNTKALLATGSHMVSGPTQGRLLTQLASMTREGRVLELGTFTGYATACLLEGVANAAEITWGKKSIGDRDRGPFVMTMERDDRARNVAITHLQSMCKHGTGEAGAEAVCALRTEGSKGMHVKDYSGLKTISRTHLSLLPLHCSVPERGEKVVSLMYGNVATCELVRVTDALAALEEMARGQGDLHPAPFDLVFVDADKTRLIEYADACLGSDRLLKKGGLIVVDNVLWKGLVLDASSSWFSSFDDDDNVIDQDVGPATKKNRRTRKLATKMHKFNREIVKDDRAEVLVLPVRDGLSIIRKR
jgi:predicted O-methyltransferase YrrM